MTVSSTTSVVTYQTNGSVKSFSIPFEFSTSEHIVLTLTDRNVSPNAVTTIDPADYTVISTPLGTQSKGSVTYPKGSLPAVASGYFLTISRIVPIEQPTDLINQSGIFLVDIEESLDRLTQIAQQLDATQKRSVLLPVGGNDTPTDFLEALEDIVQRAEDAADRAEEVQADLPSNLFKDVFTTATSTYTLTTTHNGCFIAVSPPSGGTAITLPQISSLTGDYNVCIRNMTGLYPVTISTSGSETINYKSGSDTGVLSITLNNESSEVIFVADRTGSTANKWVTFGHRVDGTFPFSKLTNLSASSVLGNSASTVAAPASVSLDAQSMSFRGGALSSLGSLFTGLNSFTAASYTLDDTHRGHILNLNRASGNMDINLPVIATIGEPYVIMVRRASGTDTVTLNRGGSDQFAEGAIGGTLTNTYSINTTVGATYIIYGVSTGSYANKWVPIRLA